MLEPGSIPGLGIFLPRFAETARQIKRFLPRFSAKNQYGPAVIIKAIGAKYLNALMVFPEEIHDFEHKTAFNATSQHKKKGNL